jgi:hypothetical protein
MNKNANLKLLFAVAISCLSCSTSWAMMVRIAVTPPIDRLVSNVESYIKEHPNDANGYYVLGRVHYLAFANQQVSIFGKKDVNSLPEFDEESGQNINKVMIANDAFWDTMMKLRYSRGLFGSQGIQEIPKDAVGKFMEAYEKQFTELQDKHYKYVRKTKPKSPDPNETVQHVTEAMSNFQKAISMDPNNGLYHLGFASLMEQYVNYLKEINLKEIPEDFRAIILNYARDIYLRAYEVSIKYDLSPGLELAPFTHTVSYEAGQAYIRLVEMQKYITDSQKAKMLEVSKNIIKTPLPLLTPIVFSFEENVQPKKLLGQNLQVKFDLDGDGNAELWPWVKPTTGILVWNQDGKNKITSGRQMFGSVTWWLFFKDGYHALDSLDDNRDGALTGKELAGISVWFDANSNGQSEPGEVKSLDEVGIESISVKSTGTENGWPANKTGITLKNGRTIATYDWLAEPIKSPKKALK